MSEVAKLDICIESHRHLKTLASVRRNGRIATRHNLIGKLDGELLLATQAMTVRVLALQKLTRNNAHANQIRTVD